MVLARRGCVKVRPIGQDPAPIAPQDAPTTIVDWNLIREIADRLPGRTSADSQVRTAIRLGRYVQTGQLSISVIRDVFGMAGDSVWALLDFRDGHDVIAIPITLPETQVARSAGP